MKKRRFISAFWGDLSGDELKKFVLLACGLFCVIGSFWPLKVLKDSVFVNMVGTAYVPFAKILSVLFFFPLILLYSRVVSYFSRERVIYFMVGLIIALGLLFSYALADPSLGLANTHVGPERLVGWAFYLFTESYGSLLVALFWSYVNDITTPESAKKGYGMIIFASQAGGFLSMLASNFLVRNDIEYAFVGPLIIILSLVLLSFFAAAIFILGRIVPREQLMGYEKQAEVKSEKFLRVGFFAGLKILLSQSYVTGIFGLIFFHELIATVMQFHMLVLAKKTFLDAAAVNQFLFMFGLIVQLIASIFGLFGTSYFQRFFGIRFCIMAYPAFLGMCIFGYLFFPTLSWITTVVIVAKAINYALNVPAKEVLYIPTTRDIKYKAKAWIDVFGARFAKGGGSLVNIVCGAWVGLTGGASLVIIVGWVFLAKKLGDRFEWLTKNGITLGK